MRRRSKWLAMLLSCAMTVSSVTAPMSVMAEEIETETVAVATEQTEAVEQQNETPETQQSATPETEAPVAEETSAAPVETEQAVSAEQTEAAEQVVSTEQAETSEQQSETAMQTDTESESQEQSETETETAVETETSAETESENEKKTVTGIISLEESILKQDVKQGAEESEICFPETLQATVADAEGEKEEAIPSAWKLINADAFSSEKADATFVYVAQLPEEYEIAENVVLPEITVTIKEDTEEFDQSTIIDNIKISVKADKGVFPKDSSLKAVKISGAAKEELKDAVEEIEHPGEEAGIEEEILEALEEANLPADLAEIADAPKEEFHAFDITILDKDGQEIQPDNSKGQVSVSFSNPNPGEFDTSEYSVYHQDEASGAIEELPSATNSENMVEAEATSFSPYMLSVFTGTTQLNVIELTGNEKKLTKSGIYYVAENKQLNYAGANATSASEAGGNGIKIAEGVTAYIYIPSTSCITATGGRGYDAGNATRGTAPSITYTTGKIGNVTYPNASTTQGKSGTPGTGATGGGAGIYVPENSNLIMFGDGNLNATGGDGGKAGLGANGDNTIYWYVTFWAAAGQSVSQFEFQNNTNNTPTISGTASNKKKARGTLYPAGVGAGGAGGGGAAGGGAGIGSNGANGSSGKIGGGDVADKYSFKAGEKDALAATATGIGNVYIKSNYSVQGGNGGTANTSSKSIVEGGNYTLNSYKTSENGSPAQQSISWTNGQAGGNGGAGAAGAGIGTGGQGGAGGSGGDSGNFKASKSAMQGAVGTNGTPGTMQTEVTPSSLGDTQYPYNTVTFTGASNNETQRYYLDKAGSVTAPNYNAPSGKLFKGWKVTTAAEKFPVGVEGTELIKEGQIYQADAVISTQGIYGEVVLTPVLENLYKITVTKEGNGQASASVTEAAKGTEVTLTATPDAGYDLKEWQIDGKAVTDASHIFTMPAKNVSAKAVFVQSHTHSWSYTAKGNTITATCTADGSCRYAGQNLTFTLDAQNKVFDGAAYDGVSTKNDTTAEPSAVKFYTDTELKNEISAPVNAGTYYATVTLGGEIAVATFTIEKKQIMIPAEDTTKYTYTGSEQTYVLASSNDYSITGNKRTDAGSQKATVSLKDKNNTEWTDHTTDDKTYTFNIAKADPGLSVSAVSEKTYGDADFDLQITNHGDATPTYQSSDENVLTVKDGKVTLVGAGKAIVTVSVAETGNYKPDKKTVEITVNKKAGSLTVSRMAYEVTYGTAAFSVEGLNKVGDSDITYVSSDESVVTVSEDGKISNHKAGKATVTLSMAASTNYKSASVQVSVTVVPKKITVTADELSKTYGNSDPKLTWKPSELVGKDQLENISIQRIAGEDAGKYTVTVGQTAGSNSNYEITFKNATFTINPKKVTVTADTKSKTYGSDDPKLTWQETGVKAGDELKEITAVRTSGQNVGTYNITLSQKEGANPNYAVTFVGNTFTITPKTAKVIVDDKTKTYGEKDEKLTYTTEDLVKGDNVDVTISREAGENVGTYKITASQAAGANSNYKIAFVDGTYTISKRKATVTADDKAKTYGDQDEKLTCTTTGLIEGESLEKITLSREAGENVGTYKITAVQEDGANKNYDLTFKTGTYTIGQKAVTVTAADDSKIYGDTDPELTYSKTELVGKDTLSDITVTREAGENVGTYVMTASQKDGANKNYSINFKPGTFTIKAKEVTLADKDIIIDGDGSFVYDGTEKSPTVVVMDGDKVIPESEYTVAYVNNTNASEDTKEADQKPVVIITDNKGGNYVVNGSKTFEIAKADPTLSVSAVPEKTYGDADFALEVTKTGESASTFASSDEKVLTVDKDGKVTLVGAGKATVTVSMAASRNYKEKETKVEITVKKKNATLSVSKIAYEVTYGDPDFKIGEITKEGEVDVTFQCADESIVTVNETGSVSIKKVGETNITLSMTKSANYNAVAADVSVKVLPKKITVTAGDDAKVYGVEDPKLGFTPSELVGSDQLEKISVNRAAGENVGKYAITASQEKGANGNYEITFVDGTFTINPKAITVKADAKSKVYGAKDPELTYTAAGLVGKDELKDITAVRASGESVGTYDITLSQKDGANANYTITFEKNTFTIGTKTVTVTAEDKSKTYGDKDEELTYQAEGLVEGEKVDVTLSREAGENAGTYKITASQAAGTNSNYAITFVDGTYTINKKVATVTAEDKTKTYGDRDEKLTYTADGLVGEDALEKITLSRKEGEDVGDYLITVDQEDSANPNYAITFTNGTYTIVPKDITGAAVELDGTLTYNGKEQTQNVKSVVIDGLYATFDVVDNKATNAGEYVLKITGNGNFTGTIEQKFTIEKLPGNVSFAVEADGSAPHTEIGNSEQEMITMLASAQELEAIENGDSLKIWVEITDASATVSETSKQLIQNAASDYKVGAYIDISLFKKLATADHATQINGTSKPITVSVTIPENLRNSDPKVKRSFMIVRVHNGVAEILPTTVNGNTLTFTTDKFSDYAIMYKDEKTSDGNHSNGNADGNNTSNGNAGTSNTTTVPQTGDSTPLLQWSMLLMLGLLGMISAGIYRRKDKHAK